MSDDNDDEDICGYCSESELDHCAGCRACLEDDCFDECPYYDGE